MIWQTKSSNTPLHDFQHDTDPVPVPSRRTYSATQKCTRLEFMLGEIANYCLVILCNTTVKNSTSLSSIWQAICLHYGFQSTGTHILDFNNIKLESDEHPEDLYQCRMLFVEDNL